MDYFIRQRVSNLAVVKLDFKEDAFIQKNIVDRTPFNIRIAEFGGTIGKICYLIGIRWLCLDNKFLDQLIKQLYVYKFKVKVLFILYI